MNSDSNMNSNTNIQATTYNSIQNPNHNNSNHNNFFFCYSINLLRYLRNNGIENIAKGVNPKTQKTYWMFQRSNNLDTYLNKYKQK